MPSFLSRFKGKDGQGKKKKNAHLDLANQLPAKPKWVDAYTRLSIDPREVQELIRRCTEELKARALDHPFLLLPFRPTSDPSAVRTFIRHFFDQGMTGDVLSQELRMTEPMVVSGVIKWCWGRLPGGVVGWDVYELFKVGEHDSDLAPDSFKTFIPLSVENDDDRANSAARASIIFDFFDLMSAIAAHSKTNGFGGRKLSRMASWWAFEQRDTGDGFEGGYKTWLSAADATSHLFFAYLRSLAPSSAGTSGISMIPRALEKLLQETEYPPEKPVLMQTTTKRVVMIVDTVSPTPFALLRRTNHFQYRDDDRALQEFSEYEDPVRALTEECRRVLKSISSANQSHVSSSKHSTSLRDASWSRFEDIGFASALEEEDEDDESNFAQRKLHGLRTAPASGDDLGRPTTPSWADFLSSGFVENNPSNMLLPPDKVLPPIETAVRQRSSQSHKPRLETHQQLEPGELASIVRFDLDDSFWWVWMSSLAPEETPERKSAFGRCAVIETVIRGGRWLVVEEIVKGAAPEPDPTAYIAEKKSFFSWTKRGKGLGRRKSTGKGTLDKNSLQPGTGPVSASRTSIGPDQQARIQAAAQQLQAKHLREKQGLAPIRRGRTDPELASQKTNSVFTLQPVIMSEASPAMKWATQYDKQAVRDAYLADSSAGRGQSNGHLAVNGDDRPAVPEKERSPSMRPQASMTMPMSLTPQHDDEEAHMRFSEKAIEAPRDAHPAERSMTSPVPPPKNEFVQMPRETMMSPEPLEASPESKKRGKLHKEKEKEKTGGFRKLFGRKNRSSKLPENAAEELHSMMKSPEPEPEPEPERPRPIQRPVAPAPPPVEPRREEPPTPEPRSLSIQPTPVVTPPAKNIPEPTYEPSMPDAMSRVDTEDAREAHQEFSRFDQGPLMEQPAFVPDSDDESDDATPPPIQRHAREVPTLVSIPAPPSPEEIKPAPVGDRWAQIRKNAAERAAAQRQSEEQSRGGYSKTTDGDDDTSGGEETIESRVARIKARVAELTGTMEQITGPGGSGASTPPPIRR